MFDEPRLRDLAARIHRVRIVQAPSNSGALGAEGGLLLGWLATRLGWKATSLAGRLRLLRPNDGTVQAQLVADPAAQGPRGSLVAIQIEASQGTGSEAVALRGSVERRRGEANAALWQLDVTQGGEARHIEQHVELRANEPARLLERTLRRPAFDLGLSESVAWADELLGEELACA
jgi:glucose-6-phosphate dehydrogenase assembly protein OpcA